ncbi:MAG: hypothetical protein COW00_02210 [Bdellovibrio sp. CG12_big_fil_rev_8_21_14_0_65_39_13]|nr:MAG: hypothetical protein COW78_14465 [Bdellovibrio sp. CG22_combo_CG10-13_8_21_14_all_39_27]PIQ62196.1 MAG: hypothetical protein COW00_02210 [Bdellovibrio sp. CG12_big_fil_rev_8_21_14_0_65_39_13]PIR34206.1 MAG: hypothetical protein COV37_13955 [Bdellovibrio sp. CG11_big_fil_rev_8_21_14_0_20_39_38]PJB54223.1 MAG: hypothetical protein CO099_02765 [Bdellovibrio sp. CG_4_9_14_3_um_filter_39_7]
MKAMSLLGLFLISFGAMAEGNVLSQKVIDLGNISDAEANVAVKRSFEFTRTAKSPEKVTLKYKLNFLKKDCVAYEVIQEEVPEFKKIVCAGDNTGHHCEEKVFSGLFNAKTVCMEQGLVRVVNEGSVTLNFKKAVALSPTATERIAVTLKQNDMKNDQADSTGSVLESASLYEVKKSMLGLGSQIVFKAK